MHHSAEVRTARIEALELRRVLSSHGVVIDPTISPGALDEIEVLPVRAYAFDQSTPPVDWPDRDGFAFETIVTATGSAGSFQIDRWHAANEHDLVHQSTSNARFNGRHIRLAGFNQRRSEDSFLVGAIHNDSLELSVISMSSLDVQSSVRVSAGTALEFSITAREETGGGFTVFAAVVVSNQAGRNRLQLHTFKSDGNSLQRVRTVESKNGLVPLKGSSRWQPSITVLDEVRVLVSYRVGSQGSTTAQTIFRVGENGQSISEALTRSFVVNSEPVSQFVATSIDRHRTDLGEGVFAVASVSEDGRPAVSVFDSDNDEPSLLGNSLRDLTPSIDGITLRDPQLIAGRGTLHVETDDQFGSALATGDFNGDGHEDVAVGVPSEDLGDKVDAGQVEIYYGTTSGIHLPSRQIIHQDAPGIQGQAEANDRFGESLAAGDFNGDKFFDLAVGVPGESYESEGIANAGLVHILFGSPTGFADGTSDWIFQGNGISGVREAGDKFGSTLTAGDLNGDQFDDLVVGVPYEDIGGRIDAGAAHVIQGSAGGLRSTDTLLHQNVAGVGGAAEAGDLFGWSMAIGRFRGEERAHLAVGAPFEAIGDTLLAGAVHVFASNNAGVVASDSILIDAGDIGRDPNTQPLFGWSLATGDFDGDGLADLALGAPTEKVGDTTTGAVYVLNGTASRNGPLSLSAAQRLSQGGKWKGQVSPGEQFGFSLAASDVNNDGFDELAVGIPQNEAFSGPSGSVQVFMSSENGFSTDQVVDAEAAEAGYGTTLALADVNGDTLAELIVGSPKDDIDATLRSDGDGGRVWMHLGMQESATERFYWGSLPEEIWQSTNHETRAEIWHLYDEIGHEFGFNAQRTLFSRMPGDERLAINGASVGKIMTLLIAAESIERGDVSLDDVVTISSNAANMWGSHRIDPEIEAGDQISLETLLHLMMVHSDNRASQAIGEHLMSHLVQDVQVQRFAERMTTRAELLGATDTLFTHPAAVQLTTPKDILTIWHEGINLKTFRTFASAGPLSHTGIAQTIVAYIPGLERTPIYAPKIFVVQRSPWNGAPEGLIGWKSGGVGQEGNYEDGTPIPYCWTCRVAQFDQGGQNVAVAVQQSYAMNSTVENLAKHGFEQIFTPDWRGSSVPNGSSKFLTQDFDLRYVDEDYVVTAEINQLDDLRLRIWRASPGSGAFVTTAEATVDAMVHPTVVGAPHVPHSGIALVHVPYSGEFDFRGANVALGDLVSGRLQGNELVLDAWRFGEYVAPTQFDYSGDGQIGTLDIDWLFSALGTNDTNFDIVPDGVVDLVDVDAFLIDVADTRPGDFNYDFRVDFKDFLILANNFGTSDALWSDGDTDGNGTVNFTDFLRLAANFGLA